MKTNRALRLIEDEYKHTLKEYPPFNSAHEGYAIIQEEVDELWAVIKKVKHKPTEDQRYRLMEEAKQVGAMALKFLVNIVED